VTDGGATIAVVLTETAPDLLGEDVPVLLEGVWSGDAFLADEVIIRHDENYEVPEQGGAYPAG
jgi:cytochrome c-type biogenesis protein CcmE